MLLAWRPTAWLAEGAAPEAAHVRRKTPQPPPPDRRNELAALLAGALLPLLLSAQRCQPELPSGELEFAPDRPLSVAPGRFSRGDVESDQ